MKKGSAFLWAFPVLTCLCASAIYLLSASPASVSASVLDFPDASAARGEYLADAGNCSSCHTVEDGLRYAGGVEFHTPFGRLFSTNITSDKVTGIGRWSFGDFYRSLKAGIRPDGSHLYPAFPYTSFAKLTDEDIASLYLFFKEVKSVSRPNQSNTLSFPFNQRILMRFWNTMFHDATTLARNPEQSSEWNRGAYLVEALGHCGACHTPRNRLGAEQRTLALTGGTYMDKVLFGYYRPWSSVNLTPHKMGLDAWETSDIVDYLGAGVSRNAVVHGPMRDVVLNSTRYLSRDDLYAIAVYLKGIAPNAQAPGPAPSQQVLASGEVVYTVHCGSCHMPSGEGDAGLGVSLVGNPIVQAADAASLLNVILYGPHLPPRLVVDRSRMKMYGKRLSNADIASVASYLRSKFGNGAGAVEVDQVKNQR